MRREEEGIPGRRDLSFAIASKEGRKGVSLDKTGDEGRPEVN